MLDYWRKQGVQEIKIQATYIDRQADKLAQIALVPPRSSFISPAQGATIKSVSYQSSCCSFS